VVQQKLMLCLATVSVIEWEVTELLKKEDQDVYFNLIHFMVQLNLSAMATLGREESGHCREVEMRVNVWTVRQEKMAVVKRWPFCGGGR